MLAQLLKNLYICTFLFFFVLYLWTDKSRKWSLRLQRRWDRKKNERPSPPTSHDNKPIPTPQKVKTAMQAPPMSGGSADGVEKKTKTKKQTKVPCFPFHTGKKKKKIRNPRSADINTSEHIISIHFLSPQPNNRFSSVRTRWLVGVKGGWGCTCLCVCPLHTFINRNYVTEFPKHELQATH